ncbi:hypothetical protein R1538_18445 [Rhizobium leguminosarum]|uniref:hypothetical protein n=1 Tax=Rhizobium leguminosarum TaxID=384 RepID=UPI00293DCE0F|nr:hypothetical protein [Rhizobium leguminosarum]MDV4163105.1 hypothetical protein [Rhizobium leguminosarum]MDV4172622.1 hypothetical protein [Rhizobium leguminosarum]
MTQPIDAEKAIELVRRQLERFLPGELTASQRDQGRADLEKARRSGIVQPDGNTGRWLRRPDNGDPFYFQARLLDSDKLDDLLKAAGAGDKEADDQVTAIAIWLLETGHRLPSSFSEFLISVLRERLPKVRGNRARDFQFCMAVSMLQEHGFSPTRNRTLHGDPDATESGCSILSKALAGMGTHITERTLERIWENYSNMR